MCSLAFEWLEDAIRRIWQTGWIAAAAVGAAELTGVCDVCAEVAPSGSG